RNEVVSGVGIQDVEQPKAQRVSVTEAERAERQSLNEEHEEIGADRINGANRTSGEPTLTPRPRCPVSKQMLFQLPDPKEMNGMIVIDRPIATEAAAQHDTGEDDHESGARDFAATLGLHESKAPLDYRSPSRIGCLEN